MTLEFLYHLHNSLLEIATVYFRSELLMETGFANNTSLALAKNLARKLRNANEKRVEMKRVYA